MELKVAVVVALSPNFPVKDRGEHDGVYALIPSRGLYVIIASINHFPLYRYASTP